MKKILLTLAVLTLALGFVSCGKNKKLQETTDLLAISFAKLGKYPTNGSGFGPDSMCYDGKDVVLTLSVQKDVAPIPNFSFDKWIKPYAISTLLGNGINTFVLGKTLETKQGGNPSEDYLKLMEENGAQFKVVVKTTAGTKTYVITPEEAKKLLAMPKEDHALFAASSVFIAQIHEFKVNKVVKDVKIEGNVCSIDLMIDEKQFVSKLETMPAILGYVILNNLELKVNGTIIPKENVKKEWDEGKQVLFNNPPQDEKGNNVA
ncbi:MAG: hypothetical protein IJ925_02680 [Muribaculaceae bacterium]|nr:hypothetical protein [Muribaculaceae bacterium]